MSSATVMSSAAAGKQRRDGRLRRFAKPAAALFILSYFLYFSRARLGEDFAADEMMNIDSYFQAGPWRALVSTLRLWRQVPARPVGAAFYLPLFHFFGLNPLPYQLAMMALLVVNSYLAYRLAKALGAGELVSGLTALLVCFHPGLTSLQYNTDMIYDVLCFLFVLATVLYYISVRQKGRGFRGSQIAIFLLLYLGALGSKEMAATIPLLLAAYEWIYCRPPQSYTVLREWLLRGPGPVLLVAVGIDFLYVIGLLFGPDGRVNMPAYHPHFTVERLVAFQWGALHDLLCLPDDVKWIWAPAIWVCFTYLAFRRNRPILRFAWIYAIITPLPIEFLENRLQGELYIPMVAWAITAAVVLTDITVFAANFLADEPIFRLARRSGLLAGVIGAALILWSLETNHLYGTRIQPAVAAQQNLLTRKVIQQLDRLHPKVRCRNSKDCQVLFFDDPFKDSDMAFIMQLWLRDRTVHVWLQRLDPLSPDAIGRVDSIFSFKDGRLIQIM